MTYTTSMKYKIASGSGNKMHMTMPYRLQVYLSAVHTNIKTPNGFIKFK